MVYCHLKHRLHGTSILKASRIAFHRAQISFGKVFHQASARVERALTLVEARQTFWGSRDHVDMKSVNSFEGHTGRDILAGLLVPFHLRF